MEKKQSILAQLPKVDKILQTKKIIKLLETYPRNLIVHIIREELDKIRAEIIANESADLPHAGHDFFHRIELNTEKALKPKVRRCVNATGIVLHTGLGRAPLSKSAQQALLEAASGFSSIEINLETGKRGNRHELVEDYLIRLTGAEAAAVVNNNAAATLLALNSLSLNKECIVSRGELITIGGSFRIPDIMKRSGAIMVEVGTTNQTWASDYEQAINEQTGLLLKVHTSNYKIAGFVEDVPLPLLIEIGKQHQLPVMHDLGSGSLIDLSKYGLPKEPVVQESIAMGADVVTFSGDKLLGGPQSGIIVGKKKYVDLLRKNQLARALRCGKLTFAALEATLRLFFDESKLIDSHATLKLLTESTSVISTRANSLKKGLTEVIRNKGKAEIESGESEIGGGSLATEPLPTSLVFLSIDGFNEEELSKKLRLSDPPIITRIHKNNVVFDLRTIQEDEIMLVLQAVTNIINR